MKLQLSAKIDQEMRELQLKINGTIFRTQCRLDGIGVHVSVQHCTLNFIHTKLPYQCRFY